MKIFCAWFAPISALSIDKGRGICGRGIGVDIPVAWSPEFLNSDPDLAAALEFLKIPV